MLPCMKRLAVSSQSRGLSPCRFRLFTTNGQWPLVSRGSVSLVFALVKGERHSPAHAAWICGRVSRRNVDFQIHSCKCEHALRVRRHKLRHLVAGHVPRSGEAF